MPVYHFTIRAYGTWMPDRPEGYTHYREGAMPADDEMASSYRRKQRESPAKFDGRAQSVIISAVLETCGRCGLSAFAIATEREHFHVVAGWEDNARTGEATRESLKYAVTRRLNQQLHKRTWLARLGNIDRVRTTEHFAELCDIYLPGHPGCKWDRQRGHYT